MNQAEIKEILNYDPESGVFTWKKKIARCVVVGRVAGSTRADGYTIIRINKKRYYAHRLAWLYMYGELPKYIDHIDTNPSNNRADNLRTATKGQNAANTRKRKGCSSKFKGVCRARGQWVATIASNNKTHFIGYFQTEEEAHEAYKKAATSHHGEFARFG